MAAPTEAVTKQTTKLSERLTELKQIRQPWKDAWTDALTYVIPRRAGVDFEGNYTNKPVDYASKRVDSTATEACTRAADAIMGNTAAPSTAWSHLSYQDEKMNNSSVARSWLDKTEDRIYAALARSNFYTALPEVFLDAIGIGTAHLYSEEDPATGTIRFIAINPCEMYIDEDANEVVTEWHRTFGMTYLQIKRQWGEKAAKDFEGSPGQRHTIVHVVAANDGEYTTAVNKRFPWVSIYYSRDRGIVLEETGYYESPYHTWRYRKNSGEVYGTCDAFDAMSDILMLQKVTKSIGRGVQLAVDPPFNAPKSMKGKINLVPRGVNLYTNPDEIITPVQFGSNFNVGMEHHKFLTEKVIRAFRGDIYLGLAYDNRQKTAEEVIQIKSEAAVVIGAVVGRLGSELLEPIIKRVFMILYRARNLPPLPNNMTEEPLKVDFDGPLFQQQKRYHQTSGILQTLQTVLPLMQVSPAFAQAIDAKMDAMGIIDELCKAGHMPASTYRDEQEAARYTKQQEAAARAQQTQAQALELAKTIPDLQKTTEPGSPLASLQGGMNVAA